MPPTPVIVTTLRADVVLASLAVTATVVAAYSLTGAAPRAEDRDE